MVFFIFIQILIEHSASNSGDPDQMLHCAAFGLGLHYMYLPTSHKKDARLVWVNTKRKTRNPHFH